MPCSPNDSWSMFNTSGTFAIWLDGLLPCTLGSPIMSTTIIGIGNVLVFMCVQTYLVDTFTIYAASALATNTIIRSVAGAVLPLAGQKLYMTLGLGWGNSLLALIAFILVPIPWILLVWGERLRKRFTIRNL